MKDHRPPWHTVCDHGFDLLFTYGGMMTSSTVGDDLEVSEEDIAMTKTTVNYWTNFIKTG